MTGSLASVWGSTRPITGSLLVNFVDQRIFGGMAVDRMLPTDDGFAGGFSGAVTGPALVPSQVAHIARDPMDPAFDDDRFLLQLSRKATGVKRALLDQTLVSGIGNIYADEALWAARIHYDQQASSLSGRRARVLLAEVRAVLAKALAEGGTSFDAQYVNVNGASGYFSHSLNVYGRQGEPCARCGTPIRAGTVHEPVVALLSALPASALRPRRAVASRRCRTGRDAGVRSRSRTGCPRVSPANRPVSGSLGGCRGADAQTVFFHAASYPVGTNPTASFTSSIGRFSSALNVVIRGVDGDTRPSCSMFAILTSIPSRCPRCSLSTRVSSWVAGRPSSSGRAMSV